jgi:hypothetical protein
MHRQIINASLNIGEDPTMEATLHLGALLLCFDPEDKCLDSLALLAESQARLLLASNAVHGPLVRNERQSTKASRMKIPNAEMHLLTCCEFFVTGTSFARALTQTLGKRYFVGYLLPKTG